MEGFFGGVPSLFDDEGDSACGLDSFDGSTSEFWVCCAEDVGAVSSGIERELSSSSVSANTAIREPTLMPFEPACCYDSNLLSNWAPSFA